MSRYNEPDWAVPPASDHLWTLVEIKSGVEVARHDLSGRGTTLLGRAVDAVHVPVHHESASRQHARIAFDSHGIPWLKDLESTHGTTVNRRRLPPAAVGRAESNSTKTGARGAMLFPGDLLQFGASTRLFSLEGPAEYDRGAVQARLQQQRPSQAQGKAAAPPHALGQSSEGPSGPGTSMQSRFDSDDDAEVDGDDREDDDHGEHDDDYYDDGALRTNRTLPVDVQVPEKHRKALEKLNAMKYKLGNLETEDGRIRRKGELTEGQEKQLQRNAEREASLKKSILELEESLYNKLYPSDKVAGPSRKQKGEAESFSNDEEEDDYFDRTKAKSTNMSDIDNWIGSEAESEKTLTAKWKALFLEHNEERRSLLPQATDKVRALAMSMEKLQASGDEEAFFVRNDLLLANEELKKIESSMKSKERAMDEAERLLKVVNGKIRCDRETGYIGEGPQRSVAPVKHESTDPTIRKSDGTGLDSMPPPPPSSKGRVPDIEQPPAEEQQSHTMLPPPPVKPSSAAKLDADFALPPPKRKRVVGPSMTPPCATKSAPPGTSASKPLIGGTLAFLNGATNSMDTARDDRANNAANKKDLSRSSQRTIDPKQDVWRAPKGQDGSGYTKLNEKFGGRY